MVIIESEIRTMEETTTMVNLTNEEMTYETRVEQCYQIFVNQGYTMDPTLLKQLKEILTFENQDLNTAIYMHVMFMSGMDYEEKGNKNAARYCALRMMQVRDAYVNPKKFPRYLEKIPYACNEKENAYIDRYTSFLTETYHYINKRLLLLTVILVVIVFFVFAFLFKIEIVFSLVNAAFIGFLNYYLQKKRLPDMFIKNQLQAIEDFVEADVLEFDRPIRYS